MIVIDDRAGSRQLIELLPGAILGRLEYGDIAFAGNGPDNKTVLIGIELKSVDDVLQCIVSGRFSAHQLPGMLQTFDYSWLVMQGVYRPCPVSGILQVRRGRNWADYSRGGRKFMVRDLERWIVSQQVLGGIHFRATRTLQETAVLIRALWGWWDKEWDDHKSLDTFVKKRPPAAAFRPPSVLRMVAAQLPGIGWELSRAVEQHFGSIWKMLHADEEEWMKIPKIGPVIAKRAVEVFKGEVRGWR